ncbi:MAG TPA: PfkB family carbohydrate kinase [Abditibacteriaceae bacterium]|jgi:fructokinase
MARAVCLGELLVDMVSDTTDASLAEATRFLKAPGGAPANVAVGLARLGIETSFVGQVGDDPYGDWLRGIVEAENVDVSHLLTSRIARTTIAFVATRADGKKDICFYRNPGADALLNSADLRPSLFDGANLFHCGSVSLSQSPCREAQFRAATMAFERGLLISFDPNWRPSLWENFDEARRLIWQMISLSHIVKVADEEWEFITGTTDLEEGAAKIREAGPRLVVVTRGAEGAYYNSEFGSGEVPGLKVNAIDTLGAGDAFVAGLLSEVLHAASFDEFLTNNLDGAVRFANACGAFATQTAGAIPSLPRREDTALLLR